MPRTSGFGSPYSAHPVVRASFVSTPGFPAVVSRTGEQEARLPRSEVAATSNALVLVSVSDGVNAGYALSSEFAITP